MPSQPASTPLSRPVTGTPGPRLRSRGTLLPPTLSTSAAAIWICRTWPAASSVLPTSCISGDESTGGWGLGLLDPQGRHHAVSDWHNAADVPGIFGDQAVVLPDEASHAGLPLFVGCGCDVSAPERVV